MFNKNVLYMLLFLFTQHGIEGQVLCSIGDECPFIDLFLFAVSRIQILVFYLEQGLGVRKA